MKTNLDEKLKKMLEDYITTSFLETHDWDYLDDETTIAQIKQAFADEGYVQEVGNMYGMKIIADPKLMTGREWYDRFEKELQVNAHYPELPWKEVMKAAMRAAGIE